MENNIDKCKDALRNSAVIMVSEIMNGFFFIDIAIKSWNLPIQVFSSDYLSSKVHWEGL